VNPNQLTRLLTEGEIYIFELPGLTSAVIEKKIQGFELWLLLSMTATGDFSTPDTVNVVCTAGRASGTSYPLNAIWASVAPQQNGQSGITISFGIGLNPDARQDAGNQTVANGLPLSPVDGDGFVSMVSASSKAWTGGKCTIIALKRR
jgi:hypothetical protein